MMNMRLKQRRKTGSINRTFAAHVARLFSIFRIIEFFPPQVDTSMADLLGARTSFFGRRLWFTQNVDRQFQIDRTVSFCARHIPSANVDLD